MKKAITTILLACTIILPNTIGTIAQEIDEVNEINEVTTQTTGEQKKGLRLNVSMTTFLYMDKWTNLTSDNNLFTANIDVTNVDGNEADIKVRVINEEGNVICEPKIIYVGNTLRFGPIPANTGKYIVQAQSINYSGYFNLKVRD